MKGNGDFISVLVMYIAGRIGNKSKFSPVEKLESWRKWQENFHHKDINKNSLTEKTRQIGGCCGPSALNFT